jgi:dihydrolipoamide dehydrogenase
MESIKTEIVVLGAGPGGYTAAFHAADRGKKVLLVEQDRRLGGICLNYGCIPSKALLHATQLISQAKQSEIRGISFGTPRVELGRLRAWKDSVIEKLAQGLSGLSQKRGVNALQGKGHFEDSQTLRVETREGQKLVEYEKAIVAAGSKPALPSVFDLGDARIMTSTEALELEEVPERLLVVGAGYIGMELGTLYASLGSQVILVEALDSILPEVDSDLARPVIRYAERVFQAVHLNTKVLKIAANGKQIKATMDAKREQKEELCDRVLVSVGRVPNSADLGLENTKVARDEKGFIKVNSQQQTADPFVYAVGDVTGGPLLAHKASKEAKIAVEVIASGSSALEDIVVPAVVFTDPEVAWCGMTEREAREKGIQVRVVRFPWSASGKAVSLDRPEGLTKLIIDAESERILGLGITGYGAGELIGEGVLALKMRATAKDLAGSIHPHPTLSETLMECAESFYGSAIHVLNRKRP